MHITALIPAYCPTTVLLDVITSLKEEGMDVVVVNDGSPSTFSNIFRMANEEAIVLHQTPNQGKGAALKYGMQYILERMECDVIVTVDADGQHTSFDARRIAEEAYLSNHSYVLGVRRFEKNIPLRSKFGNTLTRKIFQFLTGTYISDTQTGLRAFDRSMINTLLQVKSNRYEYETETLLTCIKEQIPIKEVPIATIYEKGNPTSHFHVLKDSFLIYRQLFHFAFSSLASFLLDYTFFTLFTLFFGVNHAIIANVCARVISATANFEMNRRYVFQHNENIVDAAIRYAMLACLILVCNSALLAVLVHIGINAFVAKVLTEIVLFLFSWSVQKVFVFAKRKPIRKEVFR